MSIIKSNQIYIQIFEIISFFEVHINPIFFYLWGYLKDNVYENNPQTIVELKAAITAKIREIP